MSNESLFRLRCFDIHQEGVPMKVNTDALLLGASVVMLEKSGGNRILDVGTGTGIIALMLAQAYSDARVDAIEIDQRAVDVAIQNFSQSKYSNRLTIYHGDFTDYEGLRSYDLIVSNPPYYDAMSMTSSEEGRRRARTESRDGLTLRRLMEKANNLLSKEGMLALITPTNRLEDLRRYATSECLYLSNLLTIFSEPNTPIRIVTLWKKIKIGDSLRKTSLSSTCIDTQTRKRHILYQILLREYLL